MDRYCFGPSMPMQNSDASECQCSPIDIGRNENSKPHHEKSEAIRRSEQALRRTEQRYRNLLQRNLAGIFRTSLDGRIICCNPAFAELLGCSSVEEALTYNALQFYFDALDRQILLQELRIRGSLANFESRQRRLDGSPVWLMQSVSLINDDENGEPYIEGIAIDVTDRKLAEQAAHQSEEKFEKAFRFSPMPMTIATLPEGRAVDVNHSFVKQMGYRREEVIGRTSLDLGLWVDPADRHRLMEGLLANGSISNYEVRFRTSNSEFRTVLFSAETIDMGGRLHALASFNDITHRKLMEEVLRESDSKFRTIAETAPAGIYIIDGQHFVYVNPACEKITGYSRQQLLELDPMSLAHPDYREMLKVKLQERLEGKLASERYEVKIITRQGQERSIDLSVSTTVLGGKRVILAIGFDVTEQRSLEVQFRHAQKLHAMGQLASGVAHDFNNLLTVIKGYTDIALSEPAASDLRARALEEVMGAADRATALVRQLLQFSRRHGPSLQLVNLNDVVHDVERMLRRVLPANIDLKVETPSGIGSVLADPAQIEHALINLAVNARDAMPRGGRLTLETANIVLDPKDAALNSNLEPGEYVTVTVSDEGSGIVPEVVAHIFDPFFTTKKEGLGLGLSTACGTVKQSKGHIEVESKPGAGATFRIYLPRLKRIG